MSSFKIFLAYALFIFSLGTALHAADAPKDKSKIAYTDPAKVDADFAYQGEYLGKTRLSNGCDEFTGLQVVALGGGKFDMYYLKGGLPGAGWDRRTRTKIDGQLKENVVEGQKDGLAVSISSGKAVLRRADNSGPVALERIQRVSPTLGATPPPGATVLFDGTPPANLVDAKLTPEGLLQIGSTTKMPVQDFQLHVEFRTPYMPYARGQGRANSGVYIQQRYELQVLDSFGLEGIENECGGIYRLIRPEVNMCLPPLSWQTYDIHFTAARWDATGKKIANTRLTVYHNGEPIHCNRDIPSKTGAGQKEGPEPRPIHFQNHGNPVVFRNLWIVTPSPSCNVVSAGSTSCETACTPQTTCNACCGRRLFTRCRCGR